MVKKKLTLEDLAGMVKTGFDHLQEQIADLQNSTNERFERVDHRLDQVEHRLGSVEQRLGNVERRLDVFSDEIGEHRRRIQRLEKETGVVR
jgi:archaellum component FlaC